MRERAIDYEELRGRDDIRIPNPNIFDGTIDGDCEKLYHWLDKFMDINSVETAKIEVNDSSQLSVSRIE